MSRDHRKISRSVEERNILASTTRVSQISQTDNELKLKLQAIDTSYKISNKRIRNETRELKEILQGLQRELQVSKGGNHTQYVPSLIEQPQRRPRRTTIDTVPSEERRDVGDVDVARRRSGTHPPSSHTQYSKRAKDDLNDGQSAEKVLEERKEERTTEVQEASVWKKDGFPSRTLNETVFSSRIGAENAFPSKYSPREQQRGERKRSTNDAFRGRFVTNTDIRTVDSSIPSSDRRISQIQQKPEGGRISIRTNPSIFEEFPSGNQSELRKRSLPWQKKGILNVGTREDSPMGVPPGRHDPHDAEVVFDALPDYLGGRRLSVAHGRVRKVSRGTGLPPLREERVAQKEKSAENWNDLSNCRYLRKEDQEITIDDIFRKE